MFYSHEMSTSFSPILLKLSTHLQSFITKITPLRVNKSTHHEHHIFLTIIKWKMNWEINISKSGKYRDEKSCNIDDSDADKLMTSFFSFLCVPLMYP